MQTFETITEGQIALTMFLAQHGRALSPDLLTKLAQLNSAPSAFDRFCRIAEWVYANREAVDIEARIVAAQLAEFANRNGWGVYGSDGRYAAIAAALQRDPAEGDPEAMPDYAPAASATSAPGSAVPAS
jgi:hypothetical protein